MSTDRSAVVYSLCHAAAYTVAGAHNVAMSVPAKAAESRPAVPSVRMCLRLPVLLMTISPWNTSRRAGVSPLAYSRPVPLEAKCEGGSQLISPEGLSARGDYAFACCGRGVMLIDARWRSPRCLRPSLPADSPRLPRGPHALRGRPQDSSHQVHRG